MPCNEEFLARTFGDDAEPIFEEFAGLGLRRPLDGGVLQAAALRLREIGLRYGPEAERETAAFLLEVAAASAQAEPSAQ